jgi:hypothetical protein
MEDPQAPFIRRISTARCEFSYVTVDDDGNVPERIPDGRSMSITRRRNHHFPVGGTLGGNDASPAPAGPRGPAPGSSD